MRSEIRPYPSRGYMNSSIRLTTSFLAPRVHRAQAPRSKARAAALSDPIGRKLGAWQAPDLLAVALEEHAIEAGAELCRIGLLHRDDGWIDRSLLERGPKKRRCDSKDRKGMRLGDDLFEADWIN